MERSRNVQGNPVSTAASRSRHWLWVVVLLTALWALCVAVGGAGGSAGPAPSNPWTFRVTPLLPSATLRQPVVTGPSSPSESHQPVWTWQSGGGGGSTGIYRVSVDEPDLENTWFDVTGTQWQAPWALKYGGHTLFIRERDSDGRWSPMASYRIVVSTLP